MVEVLALIFVLVFYAFIITASIYLIALVIAILYALVSDFTDKQKEG